MRIFFLLFCVISIAACTPATKFDKTINNDWSAIQIFSEHNAIITLYNTKDSTSIEDAKGGAYLDSLKQAATKKFKVFFTQAEKDTIFSLSRHIITAPINNSNHCTDFVGSLRIVIHYYSFIQQGKYSGVCNWNNLSPETSHLHKILKRKVKNVYLGERDWMR